MYSTSKQTRDRKGRQGVRKGELFSQGLMSFPFMNTNLIRRLVFNKQVDKRNFSQGLMSFPYMYTNLTKRLVFNKQADKR